MVNLHSQLKWAIYLTRFNNQWECQHIDLNSKESRDKDIWFSMYYRMSTEIYIELCKKCGKYKVQVLQIFIYSIIDCAISMLKKKIYIWIHVTSASWLLLDTTLTFDFYYFDHNISITFSCNDFNVYLFDIKLYSIELPLIMCNENYCLFIVM